MRIRVRKDRLTAYRNGAELLAAENQGGGLRIARVTLEFHCWSFRLLGFDVSAAAGESVWHDDFSADTTARYTWNLPGVGGPNALWVWGWYTSAWHSYRFVTARWARSSPRLPPRRFARRSIRIQGWPRFRPALARQLGFEDVGRRRHGHLGAVDRAVRPAYAPGGDVLRPSVGGLQFRRKLLYGRAGYALDDGGDRRSAIRAGAIRGEVRHRRQDRQRYPR